MGARGRLFIAAPAAVAGIVLWVAVWATTEPIETGPPASSQGVPAWYLRVEASTTLRWSAVVLAVGALVLATRGWRRGALLAAGLGAAWLAADTALVLSNVDSAVAVRTVAMLVLVASAALVATVSRRGDDSATAWYLLFAAGVLVGVQSVVAVEVRPGIFGTDSFTGQALPRSIAALAVLLALAAGPAPASRWRWAIATVLAVLALGLPPLGPAVALVGPLLIALTGALPRGRRGVRAFGALVVGALATTLGLVWTSQWPAELGLTRTSPIGRWAIAAGALVTGAVLGVLALVAARFLRASALRASALQDTALQEPALQDPALQDPAVRDPAVRDPGVGAAPATSRSGRDWRGLAGIALAGAGVASWLVTAWLVQQPISALVAAWRGHRSFEDLNEIEGLGWDLRWASIVLAAAGLRLLANGYRRTILVGVIAWLVVDTALVGLPVAAAVARPAQVVIGGLILAGGLVLRARPSGRRPASPIWSLLFATGLCSTAVLLVDDDVRFRDELPAVAQPAAGALGVALVLGGVLTALAAASRARLRRFAVVLVLGTAAVVALDAWRLSVDTDGQEVAQRVAALMTMAGLAAGCAWVAGFLHPAGRSVGALGIAVLAVTPMMIAAVLNAAVLVYLATALLRLTLSAPFGIDDAALPLTFGGLLTGAGLACILLLPRALSLPDTGPAAEPVPPSPQPPSRRPVAVPGVPEILEWPQPPERSRVSLTPHANIEKPGLS